VSASVNVVMISSKAFMKRFSSSCKKYIIQAMTCPNNTTCAYYWEFRLP
jgi:hypothetical protein